MRAAIPARGGLSREDTGDGELGYCASVSICDYTTGEAAAAFFEIGCGRCRVWGRNSPCGSIHLKHITFQKTYVNMCS